jgi:flavin reductase (DIM6/NTAB) family NADH-FMN oxidoreductase RutF
VSPFDELVAAMDAAMVVVTAAGADGEVDGCLVGFHSQSSIDPRRYTVWLSVANRTYRLAGGATHLGVHRLTADRHDLAERFGGRTGDDGVVKLRAGTWTPGEGGAPLLHDLPDRFIGRIVDRLEAGGDHVAFVLEPSHAVLERPDEPSFRLSQAGDITPGHPA